MRENEAERVRYRAEGMAEEAILNALLKTERHGNDRQALRVRLRQKELDGEEIEVALATLSANIEIVTPPGMEGLTNQLQGHVRQDRRQATTITALDGAAGIQGLDARGSAEFDRQ